MASVTERRLVRQYSDMSRAVLVVDQGGHSSRALVFDETGIIVAQASVSVSTTTNSAGWIEQDAAELVDSLRMVLAEIANQSGNGCPDLIASALIVQRSSIVAWDTISRQVLSPVLSWQDTRNSDWLDSRIVDRQGMIREKTGLYPNAHYGASKMRWLLDNHPEVKQAAANNSLCIAPLASFLQQQISNKCGKPVVDAVIASRSLLTELGAIRWSADLLDLFSIPENILPRIQPTLADYGQLSVGECNVPLRLLGGDQSFFSLSHKKFTDSGTVFINAGTGAFLQQRIPQSRVPEALLCAPLMIGEKNIAVAEGTVNAAATALDWFWQQSAGEFFADDWLLAVRQARQGPESVPVFFNRITASGSPDWLPAGESFFSSEAPVTLCAIAILESIVFALQRNLDCMATVQNPERIVLSGGLSRLDVFCQRLADLSGLMVLRSNDAEACARGAAMQLMPSAAGEQSYTNYMPQSDPALQQRYLRWSAGMDQWAGKV